MERQHQRHRGGHQQHGTKNVEFMGPVVTW